MFKYSYKTRPRTNQSSRKKQLILEEMVHYLGISVNLQIYIRNHQFVPDELCDRCEFLQ